MATASVATHPHPSCAPAVPAPAPAATGGSDAEPVAPHLPVHRMHQRGPGALDELFVLIGIYAIFYIWPFLFVLLGLTKMYLCTKGRCDEVGGGLRGLYRMTAIFVAYCQAPVCIIAGLVLPFDTLVIVSATVKTRYGGVWARRPSLSPLCFFARP